MSKLPMFFIGLILYYTSALAASAPQVIVSIKPFYNICASVMHSVGTPHLLLTGNSSPHDYQLKPSDARIIQSSSLVVWGGPELDSYLSKTVSSLAEKQLNLAEAPGLELLQMRTSCNWQHGNCNHHHHHGGIDPHFWLDPDNAIIIATAIANKLQEIDPANAEIYANNAKKFALNINQKKQDWQQKLAPYSNARYIVAHDAYQYFNKFFDLDGVGSITINPEVPPSINRIQHIKYLLEKDKVVCIFTEPQFNYKVVDMILNDTKVRTNILDPLGQDKDIGSHGYTILMDNLVTNFIDCMQTK